MRRWMIGVICCVLAFCVCAPVCAWDDGGFVVVDEDENAAPDPRSQARVLLRSMTLRQKISQLFIVAPESLTGERRSVAVDAKTAMAQYPVGGVILFGQNIVSETQLIALTDAINAAAKNADAYAPFIAVDEEGGSVSRIANKLGYSYAPSPAALGNEGDAQGAYDAGAYIAAYLKPLGINLDFAPVADVLIEDASEVAARSYGKDAATVSALAAGMAAGLRDGGVIPCYKHFPGHGAVSASTHKGKATSRRTLEEMRQAELIPFRSGIEQGAEIIMVSHFTAQAIDASAPVSLSAAVITSLLREEMGYDGVVITDALRMKAVSTDYDAGDAAVAAVRAGVDMLLLPGSLSEAVDALESAVRTGALSQERIDQSVERILALKIRYGLIR